jgi:fibronectin type 3 domain-containing protein
VNGANVTGVNFTATSQNQTFSISGTITTTAGGSGATVTLSGAASASTTADSSGNYSFSSLANGTYTVTPSNTGFTFTPANQSVTVNGANVTGVNFTAAAQQTHSAALNWTASTSTVSGYNVYRGAVSGGPYTLLNTSLITGLSYTDTSVQSGATYYYVTTAVDSSGVESVYSNEVTAVIP